MSDIVAVVIENPEQPIKAILAPATCEVVAVTLSCCSGGGGSGVSGYSGFSGGGGSGGEFLSNDIARVDPSGNDGTGVVGDLEKPFLTVQGAIDAIEAGSFTYPIVDIGMNQYFGTTVTTSLARIRFVGAADEIGVSSFAEYYANVCDNLVLTNVVGSTTIELCGCEIKTLTSSTADTLRLFLQDAGITTFPAITAEGPIKIAGNGYVRAKVNDAVTSNSGGSITIRNAFVDTVDSTGSDIIATHLSQIQQIFAAHNVTLTDSRIIGSKSITGTLTYSSEIFLKGIGPGGTTGQIQSKASNTDFDVQWITPSAATSGFSGYSGAPGIGTVGESGYSGFCGKSGYSGFCGLSGYSGFSAASPGASGYSGFCGQSGYSGFCGTGTSGFSGYSGAGLSGFSGYSGYSGFSAASPGASGYSGYCGLSGYSGFCGLSGYSGFCGLSGYSGFCGLSGYSGFCGLSGYSGFCGLSGYSGFCGLSGYSGFCGLSGYSGFCGLSGYSGFSGDPAQQSGYSGFSGKSGYSGFCGLSGYSGFCGLSGYSGFCGLSGYSGFCGLSGYSGFCGLSGYSGFSSTSGYSGFSSISGYSGFCGLSGYSGYSGGGGGSQTQTWTNDDSGNHVIGDVVYIDAANGVKKAKADAAATSGSIALATATIANGATGAYQTDGVLAGLSGLTAGSVYYLSAATAGAMTTTAPSTVGQYVTRLGTATSTTALFIEMEQRILL